MANRWQAIVFVTFTSILAVYLNLSPLIFFANIAIMLVTLRQGWQQGLFVAVIGSVLFTLLATLLEQLFKQAQPFVLMNTLLSHLIAWLLFVFIAAVLAKTTSWTRTFQAILLLTIIGILLFHSIIPDTELFWKTQLDELFKLMLARQAISEVEINQVIAWMTNIMVSFLVMMFVVSLFVARSWQAALYQPGGFRKEFHHLKMDKVTAGIALGIIVLSLLVNSEILFAINFAILSLFLFQGLAIIHNIVKQMNMPIGWLIALYILFVLLLHAMFVLLALIGLMDSFIDFRARVKQKFS